MRTSDKYRILRLSFVIELGHGFALLGLSDVDVGLHGGIVGVAGPLHDDVGGDAHGEGVADEGAATGVGAEDGIFGLRHFQSQRYTIISSIPRAFHTTVSNRMSRWHPPFILYSRHGDLGKK